MAFAKAGDRVMDEKTGATICKLRVDLVVGEEIKASNFHDFADGEAPFVEGETLDRRCARSSGNRGYQLFIEGEWRP